MISDGWIVAHQTVDGGNGDSVCCVFSLVFCMPRSAMIVLILTDEHESSSSTLYRMFEPRVLSSPHVRQIKCNAVNDTVRLHALSMR
jgi:hypothetical protein